MLWAILSTSLSVLYGCGVIACGPSADDPSVERRELVALQGSIKDAHAVSYWHSETVSAREAGSGRLVTNHYRIHVSIPRLSLLRASAVHGRQAVLVDYAAANHYHYEETEGVSSELRQLWNRIYRENHPHGWANEITTVLVDDPHGRYRIEISVPQCAVP
jgi:hypothetical protein